MIKALTCTFGVVLTGQSSKQFALVRQLAAALPGLADASRPAAPPRQQQVRLTPARVAKLVAAYEAGLDMNELAKLYGIHRHSVRAHLDKAGVELRRRGLTQAQVDEAVRLYVTGSSLARLGQQLGCDHTTVGRALRHRGVALRSPWGPT